MTETLDWTAGYAAEKNRAPSWFDFEPISRRMAKITKDPESAKVFILQQGAKWKQSHTAKAHEITEWTWEQFDDLVNHVERLEPPRDVQGELDMITMIAEGKGYIREEIQTYYESIALQNGIGTTRTMALLREFIENAEDITPAALAKQLALTPDAQPETTQAEAGATPDTAQSEQQPEAQPEPQQVVEEPKKKAKGGKKPKEPKAEVAPIAVLRMIDECTIVNAFRPEKIKPFNQVMYSLARIKAEEQWLNAQYTAQKKQNAESLKGWNACYLTHVQAAVKDQFNLQRVYKVNPETGENEPTSEFKPATVKTLYGTWSRKPTGGYVCTDEKKWQLHLLEVIDKPEILEALAENLNEVQEKAFCEVFNNWQLVVTDADAKRLLALGINLPGWTIEPGDDIGKPSFKFELPKQPAPQAITALDADDYLDVETVESDAEEVTEDEE